MQQYNTEFVATSKPVKLYNLLVEASLSEESHRRLETAARVEEESVQRSDKYAVDELSVAAEAATTGELYLRGIHLLGSVFHQELARRDDHSAVQEAVIQSAGLGSREDWRGPNGKL